MTTAPNDGQHSKYEHVYPIIRVDLDFCKDALEHPELCATVVKVFLTNEEAKIEAERLNTVNAGKNLFYQVDTSRLIPDEEEKGKQPDVLYKYRSMRGNCGKDCPGASQCDPKIDDPKTEASKADESEVHDPKKNCQRRHLYRLIVKREFFFANREMLNDPFEFRFKLKNERSLSEKRQGEYELNVEDGQSGLSAKINAHCMVVKFLINPQTMQHTYDRLEKQNQKMGVFSLSKDPKGILMWAHYADAHRGICVGIKPQFKVLLEKGRTLNGFPKEVLYPLRNEYPVIDVYPTDDDAKKSMLSKSIDWKYEKEWRLILAEEKGGVVEWKNGPLRLRDNAISEIIFGCEMEIGGDDEMAVREWVSEIEGGENIQFMRAKRHPSEYALEIKPIE